MDGLLSVLGVAGGATPWGALLGGVFGGVKNWLDNRHEEKMVTAANAERALDREHDLALIDKEIMKETAIAEMELKETMFKTDALALRTTAKSQDSEISALGDILDGVTGWVRWFIAILFAGVTVIQKLTRPGITFCLFGLTCYLFLEVNNLVGGLGVMTSAELNAIYSKIIFAALSMTELAITFWFVSRPRKR